MELEGMKQLVDLGPFKIQGPDKQESQVLSSFLQPGVELVFLTFPFQQLLLGCDCQDFPLHFTMHNIYNWH